MPETMITPENATESSSGYFWIDDGIVHILNKTSRLHNLSHAQENIEISRKIAGGGPRPFLIDLTAIKSMSREAREYYANEGEKGYVTAVALVTKSVTSRIVANFFLGFNKPGVPTKLFNTVAAAQKWLQEYI